MDYFLLIIGLYVAIGIVLYILGYNQGDSNLERKFSKMTNPDIHEYAANPKMYNKIRVWSIILGIRILIIIIWLPVTIYVLGNIITHPKQYKFKRLSFKRKRPKRRVLKSTKPRRSGLYFYQTFGHGEFECHNCGYSQELTSDVHGFGENAWYKTGYQCESCEAFQVVKGTFNETESPPLVCECGGKLSRDNPIICPICKSANILFLPKFIT